MRQPELRFVPIALGTRDFDTLDQLGKALADVIAAERDPVLLVASSDMNHYESDSVTRVKDQQAIERILRSIRVGFSMWQRNRASACAGWVRR